MPVRRRYVKLVLYHDFMPLDAIFRERLREDPYFPRRLPGRWYHLLGLSEAIGRGGFGYTVRFSDSINTVHSGTFGPQCLMSLTLLSSPSFMLR
jgi:hypothetical protein